MKTKIDLKKVAMTSVGQLGGLAITTQINRIPFIKKIDKPAVKGALMFGIGSLLIPWASAAAGLNKKGSSDIVDGVASAVSVYGLGVLGNAVAPNIFPAIAGYEDSVYGVEGMGLVVDEDEKVEGYEDSPMEGIGEEEGVFGDEDEY